MSDDSLHYQTQAFIANSNALNAQNEAFTARMRANEANRKADDNERALRSVEAANKEMEGRLLEQTRINEQINTEMSRAAFVTEAITAIPFLRQEITTRYDYRAKVRAIADQWLSAVPLSTEQGDLLISAIDCLDGKSQSWFPFALASSLAADAGDAATAEKWMVVAMAGDKTLAAAWHLLDAARTGNQSAVDARFKIFTSTLDSRMEILRPVWRILLSASHGNFGPAAKQEVTNLLKKWHDQWSKEDGGEPSAAFMRQDVAGQIVPPAAKPDWVQGLEKHGSWQAKAFAAKVATTWSGLSGVEQAFNKVAAPDNEAVELTSFAKDRMKEIAAIQDHDETKHRARLSMYMTAEESEGNRDLAEKARQASRKTSRGIWHAVPAIINGIAEYTDLKATVLHTYRDWIAEYTNKFPAASEFKTIPPIQERHKNTLEMLQGKAAEKAVSALPAGDLYKGQQAAIRKTENARRGQLIMNSLKGAAIGFLVYLVTSNLFPQTSSFNFSLAPFYSWNLLTSSFWPTYPLIFAYIYYVRKKRELGIVNVEQARNSFRPPVPALAENLVHEAKICDQAYADMCAAVEEIEIKRQRIAKILHA